MNRVIRRCQVQSLCFYVAWTLYAAPTLVIVAWSLHMRPLRTSASILVTFCLVAYLVAALTRNWRRFFLLQFPISLLGVAFVTYTIAFGITPGTTLASILVGASLEELEGFLDMPQARQFVVLLAVWSVCYLVSASTLRRRIISFSTRGLARLIAGVVALPLLVYAATNSAELIDGLALQPTTGTIMFAVGDVPRLRAKLRDTRSKKTAYLAQHSGGEEVHVLVVGESARRDSWSAYGYSRPTTPYLDSLHDEAIFLQDAMADANLTTWSVPMMLTGTSPEVFSLGEPTENIFDVAKESGYLAVLLANQDPVVESVAGIDPAIIESALDFSGHSNAPHTLDGELLPAFRRKLARGGKARFIALHMMGSHWEYFNRYPKQFQRFGSAKELDALNTVSFIRTNSQSAIVDAYDNSVLYTDWFLQQVIEQVRGLSVPATVTFFPDHGEDLQLLDGRTGHGLPIYTSHAFEIPAFVWANDAYRALHPDVIAALRNNAAKEIRTHNVFFTLADMMGIKWPGMPTGLSFASSSFVPDTTGKHIAGGVPVNRVSALAAPSSSRMN